MTYVGGVFNVLATPFGDDGALDLDGVGSLVRMARAAGVDGLTAMGVMGEAAYLDEDERALLLAAVLDHAGDDLPVLVGVSSPDTAVAAERAERVHAAGAAGLMVALPAAIETAADHFAAVAAAAPGLPIVLQDYPPSGHPRVSAQDIAAIADRVPAIRAVKAEDTPTPAKIAALRALRPDLRQLGGLSGLWLGWELRAGSDGTMTGFAVPELLVAIVEAARSGDVERADRLYRTGLPAMVWEAQPGAELRFRKALLKERGAVAGDHCRAPLPPAPDARTQAVEVLASLRELVA